MCKGSKLFLFQTANEHMKKILHATSVQGKAHERHTKAALLTRQDGCDAEDGQADTRVRGEWSPCVRLMGCKTVQPPWETA